VSQANEADDQQATVIAFQATPYQMPGRQRQGKAITLGDHTEIFCALLKSALSLFRAPSRAGGDTVT
jgi:hypothetical protein